MYKKKWASITLAMMLILSLTIGAGTFALFTSQATNEGNFFQAGTIDLGTNPEPMYYTGASHPRDEWMQQYDLPEAIAPYGGEAMGGWAPGDAIPREMEIVNSGTLDVIVKGVHAKININATPGGVVGLPLDDASYAEFINVMNVKIVDRMRGETDGLLFEGSLRDLLNIDSGGNGGKEFDVDEQFIVANEHSRVIDFLVTMDLAASNELQGVTYVFDFVFYAEQQRNNPNQPSNMGTVSGTVTDTAFGEPINGATVDFGNGNVANTDQNGEYSIDLPEGSYSGTASAPGYDDQSVSGIGVLAGQTTIQDFVLDAEDIEPSLPEGDWEIRLNWTPGGFLGIPSLDLDAHLTMPRFSGSSQRQHIYYPPGQMSYSENGLLRAKLNQDWGDNWLETGNGTETITISNQFTGSNDVYRYFVHDFTNKDKNGKNANNRTSALGNSGATVKVYKGGVLLHTFNAPRGVEGTLWTVFTISGDQLDVIDQMSYHSSPSNMPQSSPGLYSNDTSDSSDLDTDIGLIIQDIYDNLKPNPEENPESND